MQKQFLKELTIGNDIVDLHEQEPPLHPRYIQRVFTAHEQSRFGADISKMWLNWSAKEAAYKAISRIFPETVFSPLDFELINDELISFKEYLLHHKLVLNDRYALSYCSSCLSTLHSAKLITWIKELPKPSKSKEHSLKIRDFVKGKLADFYGIAKSELQILRQSENNAAPTLIISKKSSNTKLSFSHHGNLMACLFLEI